MNKALAPWHILRVAKKNPPLAPPCRLEDRRQGGESEEERFHADTGQPGTSRFQIKDERATPALLIPLLGKEGQVWLGLLF